MSRAEPLKVSIAMATYNGGKYLREQLDSFLAQTRLPNELVITDDCSTDDTLAIIETFAASAPFEVRWERNVESLGCTQNFNKALQKTTGELVFISDQDDVWYPDKLKRMATYAGLDPGALVLRNDAAMVDSGLNRLGFTKLEQVVSAGQSPSDHAMGCASAVRRELLDLILPIPEDFPGFHDAWIEPIAQGIGRKRVFFDELQVYRRHEENTSQGVTSRTVRVGRIEALIESVKRQWRAGDEGAQRSYRAVQLQLGGVRRARAAATAPLSCELESYAKQLETRRWAMEARMDTRNKPRVARLPAVVRLWINGGYREFAGVKSVVRDLFIP